jgi:hypothetical protein
MDNASILLIDKNTMEKNLVAKNFIILSVFATATLLLWAYSVTSLGVQKITNSSIHNLENMHTIASEEVITPKDTISISNNNFLENYYLVPKQIQTISTKK